MRLFEGIKKITSIKLNVLVVFVCFSLIELTSADQYVDSQQHYSNNNINHQSHHQQQQQQIRRIFDQLENHNQQRQQNAEHQFNGHLVNLMRRPEQQTSPDEHHLARHDRIIGDGNPQQAAAGFSQPVIDEQLPQSLWTNSDNVFIPTQTNSKLSMEQFNVGSVGSSNPNEYLQQHQQQGQYFAYRPLPVPQASSAPTTPSIGRQLMGPPQFYEFALSPTNAVQLEHVSGDEREPTNTAGAPLISSPSLRMSGGKSLMPPPSGQAMSTDNQAEGSNLSGVIARNNGQQVSSGKEQASNSHRGEESEHSSKAQAAEEQANSNNNNNNSNNAQDTSNSGSANQDSTSQQAVDKTIEPRQRRRIFNRILKKAEWNHLFVELSKVFLRYFLDLALKDIIGKQSGSTDSTTSRKKLDAQSELTDLLKDFVKTAISNI